MKQYHHLLKTIIKEGTYKPAARENMPGTKSLFGYQFRHDLSEGFPLLTSKKIRFKNIITELLWFLKGDVNIKYLIDNGCNIWNEDAYNYYLKICKENGAQDPLEFDGDIGFLAHIKEGKLKPGAKCLQDIRYEYGDCGHQYGKVWRDWQTEQGYTCTWVDQIKVLVNGLRNNPEGRRHILTSIDPGNQSNLALYWCHALTQFNCRPLTLEEKIQWVMKNLDIDLENLAITEAALDSKQTPQYYLDCQMYQRSADVFLGVPYNIASYALFTHILSKMCNMIPGEFIHTFGDVHIYDNHIEAVKEQLKRKPRMLPTLDIVGKINWNGSVDDVIKDIEDVNVQVFNLLDYKPHPPIKAELSTGLIKS
jgi:thymidylate synthase